MGTLSGERKKAQPNPRPTGGRLPRRTPLPSPVIPAGFRRGRPSIFFLPILFGGGRQATGREHFTIEGVRGASIPAEEKIKCALIWRWPQ